MTTSKTKKTSPSQEPRPVVEVEPGVAPLKALHKVIYGNAETAVPQSFFTPVSESERNELLAIGAAVELDEIEKLTLGITSTAAETTPSDSDVIA